MLSALTPHVSKLKYLVGDNSSAILTGVGIAGTVGTAVLTGRASFKAAKLIEEREREVEADMDPELRAEGYTRVQLSKTQRFQLVWPHFIPPVVIGGLTITSIFAAHRVDSKKIAALAMATGVSERALQEYKEKVVEKLGENNDRKVRDSIAEDHVTNDPPSKHRPVVIIGGGEVLCRDDYSGRYFMSSVDAIKKAENDAALNIIHYDNVSLGHFYDELGLPQTTQSSMVGWNHENRLELEWSTVLTDDEKPCVVFTFKNPPIVDYDRVR